jgi:hypothetical protein
MTTITSALSGVRVGCLALQGSFREHMSHVTLHHDTAVRGLDFTALLNSP